MAIVTMADAEIAPDFCCDDDQSCVKEGRRCDSDREICLREGRRQREEKRETLNSYLLFGSDDDLYYCSLHFYGSLTRSVATLHQQQTK